MSTPSPNAVEPERLFRSARRRDWLWVLGCHGLAIGLTGLVLVGLCAPQSNDVPFPLYPHLFYWTLSTALVESRVVTLCWLLGWGLGPVCFYRAVSYYQRGATRSLLAMGARHVLVFGEDLPPGRENFAGEIGRASCRERV